MDIFYNSQEKPIVFDDIYRTYINDIYNIVLKFHLLIFARLVTLWKKKEQTGSTAEQQASKTETY